MAEEKTVSGTLTDANARALLVCSGPLEHYDFLIKEEELRNDEQQRRVVQHLQKLHESLKGYTISSKNLLSKVGFIMMINIFFFLKFYLIIRMCLKTQISVINLNLIFAAASLQVDCCSCLVLCSLFF